MPDENTRIESGPTKERIVRSSLMLLLLGGGAVWFAYDGWKGYADKNFQEHLEVLPPEDRDNAKDAAVYPGVTEEKDDEAREALRKLTPGSQRDALEKLYGGPPSFENEHALYYYGPYYRVEFPIKNGKLVDVKPQAALKREVDINVQRYLAIALGTVALFVLIHVVRVMTTRLVLDENGLSYRGKGTVAWNDMTALESDRFRQKGWVDLVYSNSGDERRMRLDEYHLKEFAEIIARICDRKGFEDPVKTEKAEKAERAAKEAQA